MPELFYFEPTWLDREFKKALRSLGASDRQRHMDCLEQFLRALQASSHPTTDPVLAAWRPGAYRGVTTIRGGGQLVEYRLPGLMRVIGCFRQGSRVDRVVLLTATLKHDHERMKRLIKAHRQGIADSLP